MSSTAITCSRPFHCPCGCGSHGGCFMWGYEDEVDHWQRPADGPPEIDYPEGHSPFCHRDCTHSCHDAYDEWAAGNGSTPTGGGS